jgi:hypothetical protein
MRTMIQLVIVGMLMFTSCKKDELEQVKPIPPTEGTKFSDADKVITNSADPEAEIADPSNPNKKHY